MADPVVPASGAELDVQVCWLPAGAPAEIRTVRLSQGASLADAVSASGLECLLPDASWRGAGGHLRLAVYGVLKPATALLQAGDRIDITRPLMVDPKEARRQRARKTAAAHRASRG